VSFAITAVVTATAVVGASLYGADQARKGAKQQLNAAKEQAEKAAAEQAKAETDAANAANAKIADDKRRRRSVLGAVVDDKLGAPAGGGPAYSRGSGRAGAPLGAGVTYGNAMLGQAGAIFAPGGAKNPRNIDLGG
jgi:membrane protein involved in colicin uptake